MISVELRFSSQELPIFVVGQSHLPILPQVAARRSSPINILLSNA
jgi:hypothetical protein